MITIDIEALASALADKLQQPSARVWLTTAQAAEHLGVSEQFIRDRLHEIPHSRVDRRLFFDRQELDSWLTNHRRG